MWRIFFSYIRLLFFFFLFSTHVPGKNEKEILQLYLERFVSPILKNTELTEVGAELLLIGLMKWKCLVVNYWPFSNLETKAENSFLGEKVP